MSKTKATEANQAPAWMQVDSLHGELEKLCALIDAITGEGFESFESMSEDKKAWYLVHLSDFANQCTHDAGRITKLLGEQAQATMGKVLS